jgi:hypothetical protein
VSLPVKERIDVFADRAGRPSGVPADHSTAFDECMHDDYLVLEEHPRIAVKIAGEIILFIYIY